ncbi:MAG: endonuclease NucS [Halobacteriaceae archaeon]
MTADRVRARSDPSPETAREVAAAGKESDAVVTVFGRCEVEYDGRASSYLGPGDRLVVLKPDGTLLVHTEEQRTPVNWQPPGSDHDVAVADGSLVVTSVRESPDERIVVRFEAVHQVSALAMADERDLELVGSEADLKERLLAAPERIEDGFKPLATERETPAGAVDIYGEDADGNPVVVELKRRRVGPDAVGQLDRYVTALDRDLHADASVRGILVAPSVTDRAARLLDEHGLAFVSVAPDEELDAPTPD